MFDEDDLLPISALQHLLFCERQCALIHLEGAWADNALTVEGSHLHGRVDDGPQSDVHPGLRIVRGLALRSVRVGLVGRADVVEFRALSDGGAALGRKSESGLELPGVPGRWWVYPVEYKRGRPKRGRCDEVQLCAQAICLEEMFQAEVPTGALFYGQTRRRCEVWFDEPLRAATEGAVVRLRALVGAAVTPRVAPEKKCDACSLRGLCLPELTAPGRSAARYLTRAVQGAMRPVVGAGP